MSRHCRYVWRDTAFIRHGSVRGDVLLCSGAAAVPKAALGKILVRSLLDRTVFVLGRAAAVAAPAGLVLWLLGNFSVGNVSLLRYLSDVIDPIGRFLGMDGVILLAFILGFPANETVIPIAMMIYMAEGALNRTLSAAAMSGILLANGWTGKTAACVIVFTLMQLAVLYNASLHKKRDRQPDMDGARRCAADALRRAAVYAHQSCFSLTAVFYSGSKKISLQRSSL